MRHQKGMTFIGLVLFVASLVVVAVIVMKVMPAYTEYFEVKKALKKIAHESNFDQMNKHDMEIEFDKTATIDDIESVKGSDIEIVRQESGDIIKIDYQVITPLFANVSVLLDFSASAP